MSISSLYGSRCVLVLSSKERGSALCTHCVYNALVCIVRHLKSVASSEFEPLHVISWLEFYRAWVVKLHHVRTRNTLF